ITQKLIGGGINVKIKKKMFGAFWILLLVVILAACSGDSEADGNDNNNDSVDSDSDEVVTLTYARGVDTRNSTDVLIEAFEEKHPNIKIKFQEMPSDT